MTKRLNAIEEPIKIAEDMAKLAVKELDDYLDDMDYGTRAATPDEARRFAQMKMQEFPPAWYEWPDGRREFNSSWVIAIREGIIEEPRGAWGDLKRALAGGAGAVPLPAPALPAGARMMPQREATG